MLFGSTNPKSEGRLGAFLLLLQHANAVDCGVRDHEGELFRGHHDVRVSEPFQGERSS